MAAWTLHAAFCHDLEGDGDACAPADGAGFDARPLMTAFGARSLSHPAAAVARTAWRRVLANSE
jgi:hypothetical protein